MTSRAKENRYEVPAVQRAIEILRYLANRQDASLTDIHTELGLPKSTVYGILLTLEGEGFIRRNPIDGRFELGLTLFELGSSAVARIDFRKEALPFMDELMTKTRETCNLGVIDGNEAIYLEKVECPRPVKLSSWPGKRIPLHCTALGKVLLAGQPDNRVNAIIEKTRFEPYTPNSITTPERLWAEIAEVRRQGYAVDNEEHEPEIRCVAGPVRDHRGEVVAAISIAGPTSRVGLTDIPKLVTLLKETCAKLSARLGYRSDIAALWE